MEYRRSQRRTTRTLARSTSTAKRPRSAVPAWETQLHLNHYSNSKSESEDTLPKSDGYHSGRLDSLPSEKYNSVGEATGAINAEYEQLLMTNLAEAKEMQEKLSTTVGESEEVK